MNAKRDIQQEAAGHSNGTFSRAHASLSGGCPNVPRDTWDASGRDIERAGQDIPVAGAPGTSHPAGEVAGLQVRVIPWPFYSDLGVGPVWEVKVSGEAFNGALLWSSRLGRFCKGNTLAKLKARADIAAIESVVVAAVGKPEQPKTEKRPRGIKSSGQNWMHLSAMNLIADAEAGVVVDAVRLSTAREIIARAHLPGGAA